MMSTSKYTISLCLWIAAAGFLQAQSGQWLPSALRVGTDPGALGYWIFSKQRNFFEITADTDFNNFFIAAEFGTNTYTLEDPTFSYTSNGSYLRVGTDINIMKPDKNHNVIFFGFRYAMSTFKDRLEYETGALIQTAEINQWPSTEETASNSAAGSRWIEATVGLKMRVYRQLYMGFTARYKLMKKDKRDGTLRSYYIPGFGKNIDNNSWGLNYYVYYRFPFRKKEIPPDGE